MILSGRIYQQLNLCGYNEELYLTLSFLVYYLFPLSLWRHLAHQIQIVEKQIDAKQQRATSGTRCSDFSATNAILQMYAWRVKKASLGFPQNEAQCFPINQLVLTDYQAEEENSSASSLKLINQAEFSWVLKVSLC